MFEAATHAAARHLETTKTSESAELELPLSNSECPSPKAAGLPGPLRYESR
jgi:hypothetical protein